MIPDSDTVMVGSTEIDSNTEMTDLPRKSIQSTSNEVGKGQLGVHASQNPTSGNGDTADRIKTNPTIDAYGECFRCQYLAIFRFFGEKCFVKFFNLTTTERCNLL
ncbi:hypothetical protein AVEN_212541-1 [Araneus ventricosus]|uniref:Uncharacterized protein n=1 Tax=Araneus ventricosus TaxID=182803 RepID=A0A4Y2JQS6_ARAVE|nr:hypothetical protein AVEN_212541-1 [Araneus ventricosus]